MTRNRMRRLALALAGMTALANSPARAQSEQAAFLFTYDVDRGIGGRLRGRLRRPPAMARRPCRRPALVRLVRDQRPTHRPLRGRDVRRGVRGHGRADPSPAGDGADMEASVLPHAKARAYSAHLLWAEPSTARSLEARQPSPTLDVYGLRVAPSDTVALRGPPCWRRPGQARRPSRPGPGTAWRAAARSEAIMVLVPRRTWADLAGRPADLFGLIAAAYGANPGRGASELLWSKSAEVETWSYQPKLSRLP